MSWLHRIWRRIRQRFDPPYRTIIVQDSLPGKLHRRRLYIVEEDGFQEQAALVCPCGCKQILHLNLLTDERPCWQVKQHQDGTATLQPSVWRRKGCRSHFWLRSGRITWCLRDEPRPHQ